MIRQGGDLIANSLIGKTILGYKVVKELGSGAFGTVYKVIKDNPTGTYVRALKFISIPSSEQYATILNSMGGDTQKTNEYFQEMLRSIIGEVQILNDFSEKDIPSVVRYYENDVEVLENPRRYNIYILMEYLTPLKEYLAKNRFTVRDVLLLGLDILDGLASCHQNGVIHRDVKIDNLFVTNNQEYKIGDFGVSKILDNSSRAESLKGTPDYLAPEVYLGKEGYTQSVDLYSLGIVLYRLLNYNRNPFLPAYPEIYYNDDEDRAFERRMKGEIPQPPQLGGEKVSEVLLKAIGSKEDRYQNALDFYDALEIAAYQTPDAELDKEIYIGDFVSEQTFSNSESESFDETVKDLIPSNDYETGSIYQDEEYGAELFTPEETDVNFAPIPGPAPIEANERIIQPITAPTAPEHVSALPPVKKKGKFIVIGLLLIALLGALGFFGYQFFLRSQKSNLTSPTYTVNGGEYTSPQNVQIQTTDPSQKVYYTTDGTEPTEKSTAYNNGDEIHIGSTTTLKSIAMDDRGNKSPVTSVTYTIESEEEEEEYVPEKKQTYSDDNDDYVESDSTNNNTTDNTASGNSQFNVATSAGSWDFNNQWMLRNFSATASSTLPNDGSITYSPANVLDNDSKTAWSESVSGKGIGESITLTYLGSSSYPVKKIYFLNGYTKTQETFDMNTTPTELAVYKNGSYIGTIKLKNTPDPQYATLPESVTLSSGDSITFSITDAVSNKNDTTNDTNISDIRFTES